MPLKKLYPVLAIIMFGGANIAAAAAEPAPRNKSSQPSTTITA
jgi:hypothetical protein